jgi:hypothetical protein
MAPLDSSSCCSDESDPGPLAPLKGAGPIHSCGCKVGPTVPVVPTLTAGIELKLVAQGSVWLNAESLEKEDRFPSQASRFESLVYPVVSGPPLRLLIQVFRL